MAIIGLSPKQRLRSAVQAALDRVHGTFQWQYELLLERAYTARIRPTFGNHPPIGFLSFFEHVQIGPPRTRVRA